MSDLRSKSLSGIQLSELKRIYSVKECIVKDSTFPTDTEFSFMKIHTHKH